MKDFSVLAEEVQNYHKLILEAARKDSRVEDSIPDEFEKYWSDQRVLALADLCEEENLDKKQFKSLINSYIYNEHEPLRNEVFKCLDNRPSVLKAREVGERIINKMKEFVEVFVRGVGA